MDYYNDNAPFCCEWVENLIREGVLPAGVVDSRPIQEVDGRDLVQFRRIHLFSGIGGWAYALLLAAACRNRSGRISGYGNAIVPQIASGFVKSLLLAEHDYQESA